jgi:hypothetical protein
MCLKTMGCLPCPGSGGMNLELPRADFLDIFVTECKVCMSRVQVTYSSYVQNYAYAFRWQCMRSPQQHGSLLLGSRISKDTCMHINAHIPILAHIHIRIDTNTRIYIYIYIYSHTCRWGRKLSPQNPRSLLSVFQRKNHTGARQRRTLHLSPSHMCRCVGHAYA